MPEQPKSKPLSGEKSQWSTPTMREIPLTDEILEQLELSESQSPTDKAAKKAAAVR